MQKVKEWLNYLLEVTLAVTWTYIKYCCTKTGENLLSVPTMASMEAEDHFDKEKCIVSKDGKNFVIGKLVKLLYCSAELCNG